MVAFYNTRKQLVAPWLGNSLPEDYLVFVISRLGDKDLLILKVPTGATTFDRKNFTPLVLHLLWLIGWLPFGGQKCQSAVMSAEYNRSISSSSLSQTRRVVGLSVMNR